jgi:hypothetical protein
MAVAVLFVWFVAAVVVGATGVVTRLAPPLPQATLLLLTAAALTASWAVPSIKSWVSQLPFETLVAVHLTRFIGIYFLILEVQGRLPRSFAVPCGWGDIVAAAGAAGLLVFGQPLSTRRRLLYAWNLFGLLDILFTVFMASRLARHDPASMAELLRLPLSLLPTFLVPLIIASHALVFAKLRTGGTASHELRVG